MRRERDGKERKEEDGWEMRHSGERGEGNKKGRKGRDKEVTLLVLVHTHPLIGL